LSTSLVSALGVDYNEGRPFFGRRRAGGTRKLVRKTTQRLWRLPGARKSCVSDRRFGRPSKIVLYWADIGESPHAAEIKWIFPKEPVGFLFFKSTTVWLGRPRSSAILRPTKVDWEVELDRQIVKKATYVPCPRRLGQVARFTPAHDYSERGIPLELFCRIFAVHLSPHAPAGRDSDFVGVATTTQSANVSRSFL